MGFVKISGEYMRRAFTSVDNVFIRDYLPEANAEDVRIYLYGLSNAESEDCSVESVAEKLQLTRQRVLDGFAYWAQKGLVSLSAVEPVTVTYLPVRAPEPAIIKVHAEKYKTFAEEAARIYPERVLMPNDLNTYIELMHTEKIEVNAMLLVMQYCKDLGGGKTGTKYVCAVAKAWAQAGFATEKQVADHIAELENNNEQIRVLFETLGLKRAACVDDRQMYYRWVGDGFSQDAILTAARSRKKKGGMEKLDLYMEELKKANAMTAAEIACYTENKEKIHNLAIEICKNLGVYYSNTENLTEVYILPWIGRGFEPEALLRLSKYCFLRNVHTFDVMCQMVEKIAAIGLFTESEITSYVDRQIALDETVRKVYDVSGYVGAITNRDRDAYKTWIEWGYDEETILAVAEHFAGTTFPMQSIGRTMGTLRANKIFSKEAAVSFLKRDGQKQGVKEEFQRHQYSEERLKNALINFDNWE